MSNPSEYDWAKAALSLASAESSNLRDLVAAAELDPESGDVADIDLSDMDLTGQDLAGWDLRNASFRNARIAGTELRSAIIDPFQIVQATDWKEAKLDEEVRTVAEKARYLMWPISEMDVSVRAARALVTADILYIGGLVTRTDADLLRITNFGRKTLNEVKQYLSIIGLHLGMKLVGWPPANLPPPDQPWLLFTPTEREEVSRAVSDVLRGKG